MYRKATQNKRRPTIFNSRLVVQIAQTTFYARRLAFFTLGNRIYSGNGPVSCVYQPDPRTRHHPATKVISAKWQKSPPLFYAASRAAQTRY